MTLKKLLVDLVIFWTDEKVKKKKPTKSLTAPKFHIQEDAG